MHKPHTESIADELEFRIDSIITAATREDRKYDATYHGMVVGIEERGICHGAGRTQWRGHLNFDLRKIDLGEGGTTDDLKQAIADSLRLLAEKVLACEVR